MYKRYVMSCIDINIADRVAKMYEDFFSGMKGKKVLRGPIEWIIR